MRYTGQLCKRGNLRAQRILWTAMTNLNATGMTWDRTHVDDVAKWLGFCGVSPTGLELPTYLCPGDSFANSSGAFCGSCPPPAPPAPGPYIQPLLVSARVAGYDHAAFGLVGADPSPILFHHPKDSSIVVSTTKLSSFVRGRFAPVAAWKQLWKQLLHLLIPSAGAIELEWTPSVGPAFAKDEALPPSAEVRASMTGVEWLRGRSGLLPGPRQLARIKQFLDPRWVDTTTELSNCSCKPHDR